MNTQFWQNSDHDSSIDFFTSETIDLIDVEKADYTYADPEGVAIIMPCIDKKEGLKTAKTLRERAGMPCKIIIAFDSVGHGFIKTLNTVANRISVKYIIYLAQDAFPGKYWLKMAHTQLEKTGKGLLGFNDAKWYGVIASFGMVRLSWIHEIYDNAILYPEYNSHGADNEITVIARATDQYIYNPNIVLVEVDHNKGMVGGGNREDGFLFRNRFTKGFDGRVPITSLKKIATDYNIYNIQNNQIKMKKQG